VTPSTEPEQPPVTNVRKNVALWRAHNQRRFMLEKDSLGEDGRSPFVCECTSGECYQAIQLATGEYESAHADPNWLAVAPGHVIAQDRCHAVEKYEHFWIVEVDRRC
jgi:hypothetical protein